MPSDERDQYLQEASRRRRLDALMSRALILLVGVVIAWPFVLGPWRLVAQADPDPRVVTQEAPAESNGTGRLWDWVWAVPEPNWVVDPSGAVVWVRVERDWPLVAVCHVVGLSVIGLLCLGLVRWRRSTAIR